jgi:hypothetical protein
LEEEVGRFRQGAAVKSTDREARQSATQSSTRSEGITEACDHCDPDPRTTYGGGRQTKHNRLMGVSKKTLDAEPAN